jgi:hypothetical protein
VKWGGAVVAVLLVVVWIRSGWYSCGDFHFGRDRVELVDGLMIVNHHDPDRGPLGEPSAILKGGTGLAPQRAPFHLSLGYSFSEARGLFGVYFVPMWPLPLAFVLASGIAWRLDILARRRARLNHCPKCSYDRIGLATGAKCPECGAEAAN